MTIALIEMTDEARALANNVDVGTLRQQIAANDPACILPLAAMLSVASEGLTLGFEMIGSLLPHLPPELAQECRNALAVHPDIAAAVLRGEAGA
ncbi:hypothetical protein [Gemmatimonas sp.]|uniref:hypothetical protein n=1 Tax=Gemmatimonas sp. TaxID=1962908 RepID=UPI00334228B6